MASPISEEYRRNVRPKLDLISKLQQVLEQSSDRDDIRLPRIAVVGTQSSGKSSVLERLSGVRLPRGQDLCTRVPLTLCIKGEAQSKQSIAYGKKDYAIANNGVEEEVRKATSKLVGDNQTIENKPITLRISGPSLPDLMLVDLPGIIYTAKGNQPQDIDVQVKSLINRYIEQEETIILCVFAGDADLQTSEALKLARKVDPHGKRTIGVITKVDRIEEPSQLVPKLLQEGQHNLDIKLGMIAVRNQKPAEKAVTHEHITSLEKIFFERLSKESRQIPENTWGIVSLAKRLCDLQAQNLDVCLPGVRDALKWKVKSAQEELEHLQVPGTPLESFRLLRSNFDEVLRLLKELLKNNYDTLLEKGVNKKDAQAYHVYPRIEEVNQDLKRRLLGAAPKVFEKEAEEEIRTQLKNVGGRHLPNFLSPEVFDALMKTWFRPYKELITQASEKQIECIDDVVKRCAKLVARKEFFAILRNAIQEVLAEQYGQLEHDTEKILEKEADIVHTQNDYYTVTLRKLQKALAKNTEMLPAEEDSDAEDHRAVSASAAEDNQGAGDDAEGHDAWDHLADGQQDGMIPARTWLGKKLRVKPQGAKRLQARCESHDPKDMQVLDLQLSAFCYDKVRRKRICDDLMKNARHYLLNFLEEDPGQTIRAALDSIPQEKVHECLTKQSVQQKQRRQELEAKISEYSSLLEKIDEAGGTAVAAFDTQEWRDWKDRKKRKNSEVSSPLKLRRQ